MQSSTATFNLGYMQSSICTAKTLTVLQFQPVQKKYCASFS